MKKTTKKQPVRRTAAKSTTKSTTKKTTRKAVASTSRAKKPVAKKKGVAHHAKRLYHLTPKFVHGMFVGALVGVMTVAIMGAVNLNPSATEAAGKCDAHGIGSNTLTHSTNNSAYKINGNKTTVTFNVVGKNCHLPVTMVVWKAPNGTTGKPYSAQTLFYHSPVQYFSAGRHSITGNLPGCYFQVDTVTGTKLTGSTGQAYNYDTRQVAFMHGGNTSCNKPPKPPTPPSPSYVAVCDLTNKSTTTIPTSQLSNPRYTTDFSKCAVPPVTIQVCDKTSFEIVTIDQDDLNSGNYTTDQSQCQNQPPETPPTEVTPTAETLPNTGPGAVVIIALMAVVGGVLFHKFHHHRKGTYLKNHK